MRGRSRNIHERFLRHIWSRQYLDASALHATDGRVIRVLRVGTLNLDSGPDFLNAIIGIGDTVFAGDVEIHRNGFEWLGHQHQDDPRYNKVILHVVLEGDAPTLVQSGRRVSVLVLEKFLSESIHTIWQKAILDERDRSRESIPCSGINDDIPPDVLRAWLERLAVERLELKLRMFEERLKELALLRLMSVRETPHTWGEPPFEGNADEIPPHLPELTQRHVARKELWEQILYEGMMDGLGYIKNRSPFVRLAKSLTLQTVRDLKLDNEPTILEAFLYGVAGLLPAAVSLKERAAKEYVLTLRRAWKSSQRLFHGERLHSADWQFFPTRPTNFPTVRLAAATALIQRIVRDDLFRSLIQIVKSDMDLRRKRSELVGLFQVETNAFWRRHYHFNQRSHGPVNVLGTSRINDILINTILPVAFLYARIFKDKGVREGTLALFGAFPPSAENFITRIMEKQLLKGKIPVDSMRKQQGVLQLYKYYCLEKRCQECAVGKIVFRE